jgi:hypothetical protein
MIIILYVTKPFMVNNKLYKNNNMDLKYSKK